MFMIEAKLCRMSPRLQEQNVTRASMLKPKFHSCSNSIRSPEHAQTIIPFVFQKHTITRACPNHDSVRVPRACGHQSMLTSFSVNVPRAYGHQSIHAQTPKPSKLIVLFPITGIRSAAEQLSLANYALIQYCCSNLTFCAHSKSHAGQLC